MSDIIFHSNHSNFSCISFLSNYFYFYYSFFFVSQHYYFTGIGDYINTIKTTFHFFFHYQAFNQHEYIHKHSCNAKLSINSFSLFTCKFVIYKKLGRNQKKIKSVLIQLIYSPTTVALFILVLNLSKVVYPCP